MRYLLVALALVLTLMYFTFGLRFGYVTLTPTYLLNATGDNNYSYEMYEEGKVVGVAGTCEARSGTATFRLVDGKGVQLAGQVCPKGKWTLDVRAKGDVGRYYLQVHFDKFSGMVDVKEVRGE